MSDLFTSSFWKDTIERAVKTVAQAEAALLVAQGTGILNTDWWASLSAAGMAGAVSLLSSLGSVKAGEPGTASLTSAVAPVRVPASRHSENRPFAAPGDDAGTSPLRDSGSTSDV